MEAMKEAFLKAGVNSMNDDDVNKKLRDAMLLAIKRAGVNWDAAKDAFITQMHELSDFLMAWELVKRCREEMTKEFRYDPIRRLFNECLKDYKLSAVPLPVKDKPTFLPPATSVLQPKKLVRGAEKEEEGVGGLTGLVPEIDVTTLSPTPPSSPLISQIPAREIAAQRAKIEARGAVMDRWEHKFPELVLKLKYCSIEKFIGAKLTEVKFYSLLKREWPAGNKEQTVREVFTLQRLDELWGRAEAEMHIQEDMIQEDMGTRVRGECHNVAVPRDAVVIAASPSL